MKRGIIPLALLLSIPFALAQESVFGSAFSLIFGSVSNAGNDLVLKVGLWLAMIFIFFQGAQKVFKHKDATGQEVANKKIAITFAILISTIAVRFMPPEWAAALGSVTWIAVVILLPYTLISFVTDNKWAKIIGTALFVLFMSAGLSSYGAPYFFPVIRGSEFLSDIYYTLTPSGNLLPLFAAGVALIIFFLWGAKGAKTEDGGSGGSSGPGLFNKALTGLGKAVATPFKALGHGISGLGKGLGYAGLGLGKGIGGAAHGVGKLAGGAIGGIGKGAKPLLSGVASGTGSLLKGAGELGGAALGKGVPAAARGLGKFGGWLKNKFKRKTPPSGLPPPPATPYGTPINKAPSHTKIKKSYVQILGMMRKDEKRLKELTKGGIIPPTGTKEFTKYVRTSGALNKHRSDLKTMTPPSVSKPVPTRLLTTPGIRDFGRKTGADVDKKILNWQSQLRKTTDPRRTKRINDVIAKLQQVRKHRP